MESSLLNTSSTHIEKVYHQVLKTITKNKWTSISAAVLLSTSLIIHETILKPPKNLRHIPYHSYFDAFWSSLRGESYYQTSKRIMLPYINSNNNYRGLYCRLGRAGWMLHISDPETIKYVLMKHELYPRVEPHLFTSGTLLGTAFEFSGFIFSRGKEWKDQRIAANPFIRGAKPIELFGELTSELFKVMPDHDEVDMRCWLSRLVFDIMGKSLLGCDHDTLHGHNIPFLNSTEKVFTEMQHSFFFYFPYVEQLLKDYMPNRLQLFKDANDGAKRIRELVTKRIEDVRNGTYSNSYLKGDKDLLTTMVEGYICDNGNLLTEDLLVHDIQFISATAHAATHSTLQYAMYYLAKYPEIQQRAREEVLFVLGNDPLDVCPTLSQLAQLTYIDQILKETLRLNTSAVRGVPRDTNVDSVFNGVFVPKGTHIQLDFYNVQNSTHWWQNPSEFNPERFATNGEAFDLKGEGMKFAAFGGGTRQCFGMKYALSLMSVVMVMILRKYRWSLPNDDIHKHHFNVRGAIIVAPVSMKLILEENY